MFSTSDYQKAPLEASIPASIGTRAVKTRNDEVVADEKYTERVSVSILYYKDIKTRPQIAERLEAFLKSLGSLLKIERFPLRKVLNKALASDECKFICHGHAETTPTSASQIEIIKERQTKKGDRNGMLLKQKMVNMDIPVELETEMYLFLTALLHMRTSLSPKCVAEDGLQLSSQSNRSRVK